MLSNPAVKVKVRRVTVVNWHHDRISGGFRLIRLYNTTVRTVGFCLNVYCFNLFFINLGKYP